MEYRKLRTLKDIKERLKQMNEEERLNDIQLRYMYGDIQSWIRYDSSKGNKEIYEEYITGEINGKDVDRYLI